VWTRICFGLALGAAAIAAGCGGGGDKDKEAAGKECGPAPAAMSGKPTLPAGFPQPAEVTYTGQAIKGPTTVVSGYYAGDVDAAYKTYKESFKDPFEVEGGENEHADAEVEFKGSGKSGQIKLQQTCKDRSSLTVTIRPE
jgi:hypothetical protein